MSTLFPLCWMYKDNFRCIYQFLSANLFIHFLPGINSPFLCDLYFQQKKKKNEEVEFIRERLLGIKKIEVALYRYSTK